MGFPQDRCSRDTRGKSRLLDCHHRDLAWLHRDRSLRKELEGRGSTPSSHRRFRRRCCPSIGSAMEFRSADRRDQKWELPRKRPREGWSRTIPRELQDLHRGMEPRVWENLGLGRAVSGVSEHSWRVHRERSAEQRSPEADWRSHRRTIELGRGSKFRSVIRARRSTAKQEGIGSPETRSARKMERIFAIVTEEFPLKSRSTYPPALDRPEGSIPISRIKNWRSCQASRLASGLRRR